MKNISDNEIVKIYNGNKFVNRFDGLGPFVDTKKIISIIEHAVSCKDMILLSMSFDIGFHFDLFSQISRGGKPESVNLCNLIGPLIEQDWHGEHENIVDILQKMNSESAVKAIESAVFAKPSYLVETDDADSLSRRAIWALGKLVSPIEKQHVDKNIAELAKAILNKLAKDRDLKISIQANRQIDRINSIF